MTFTLGNTEQHWYRVIFAPTFLGMLTLSQGTAIEVHAANYSEALRLAAGQYPDREVNSIKRLSVAN